MSTLLTALNPHVLPHVGGCANVLAQFHIRQAAIEFIRRTLIWRKTLPVVPSVLAPISFTAPLVAAISGTLTVPFSAPTRNDYVLTFSDASTQIVTLTNGSTAVAWTNPVTATVSATYSQLVYAFPVTTDASIAKFLRFTLDGRHGAVVRPDQGDDQVLFNTVSADCAWTTDRVNFSVYPAPRVAGTLYGCTVALQPTQTSTTIPDDVFDGHAEDIAQGALARLFALPKKDWTDTTLAGARGLMFNSRIATVANQVSKGFSRGKVRVKGHFF